MGFITELLNIYGMFVNFLFTFPIAEGITMGHMVVSLLLIMVIFTFLMGRLKRRS